MKLTLTKSLTLHTAYCYLQIKKQVKRDDIQEFLNGDKKYEPIIENRIKVYLKNIGIYDDKYNLTTIGNKAKETGLFYALEEGKYQIWYTKGDYLFGYKIVHFERVQPTLDTRNDSSNVIELNSFFQNESHFSIPIEDSEYFEFSLNNTPLTFTELTKTDTIKLTWMWETLNKSVYTFEGKINKNKKDLILIPNEIKCPENLEYFIQKILPNWSTDHKRNRIDFNSELSNEINTTFIDSFYKTSWRGFDVSIEKLPIMPYSEDEAAKWRDYLILNKLEKQYLNPKDLNTEIEKINDNEALKPFNLLVPTAKEISKLTNTKTSFWHLYAPMDLNPTLEQKINIKTSDLV